MAFLGETFPLSLGIRKVIACLGYVFTYVRVENDPLSQRLSPHDGVAMATCPWIVFSPPKAVVILNTLTLGPGTPSQMPVTSAATSRCSGGDQLGLSPRDRPSCPVWQCQREAPSPPPSLPIALPTLGVVRGGCSLNLG